MFISFAFLRSRFGVMVACGFCIATLCFAGSFLDVYAGNEKSVPQKKTADLKTAKSPAVKSPALKSSPHGKQPINFTQQIRPLLSDACFHCHGPAKEDRQADLRLDTKEGAFTATESGIPIVPGKSKESLIYERIMSKDADMQMPPADSGKKLTAKQKELIRQWIDEGAQWSEHWAFIPPKKSALPKVKNGKWVQNPIDHFVLHRLEKNNLSPSKKAEKLVLLRRLYLDLTGLPPTVREIDKYLKDKSPDAYSKKVDELLKSPQYGVKWARHWLDAARYSDSDGFEKDKPRFVWNYRDWVVRSLNADMPYNQFLVEQLAGDLLQNPTQDQLIATGFLRNSMLNEEGGVDPEQFRMEAMFDRMDAIGKSVLGLTIQCAQCHNHKYDPITQEEYYQMFAFINNSHEHTAVVYSPKEELQQVGIRYQIGKMESSLKQKMPDWQKRMNAWENSARKDQTKWDVLKIANSSGSNSERYYPQADGSLLSQGYAPARFTSKFAATVENKKMNTIRLEALTDPNLPASGPGRGLKGLFALTEFQMFVSSAKTPEKKTRIKFIKATADFSNEDQPLSLDHYMSKQGTSGMTGSVSYAIDDDSKTAWGIDAGAVQRNQSRTAVFVAEKDFAIPEGTRLEFQFRQTHGGWNSNDNQTLNIGRFRISVSDNENAVANVVSIKMRKLLAIPREKRTAAQIETLFSYWRTTVPEWKTENEQIAKLWKLHPEGSMQMVMKERQQEPRATYFLERGDFLKRKQKISPGVPSILNSLPTEKTGGRLAFAKWVADPKSPTVARAAVNRAWQAFFGIGIVATNEDLGSQGAAPSHPKLLDWLAVDFVEQNWSLKKLHRTIVMSATYQQSSKTTAALLKKDPYNRLLAHGSRFRVDGEIVRDISLFASGLINLEMGGPGVYPPSAKFLYLPPASYGTKHWPSKQAGKSKYRRALYTFRYRSVPHPVLKNFDTPNGDASCVRRDRSNTPLQALTTLNEPLFLECAQALSLRVLQEGGTTDARKIRFAFRTCLTREPTKKEMKLLTDLVIAQRKRIKAKEIDAKKLMTDDSGNSAVNPPTYVVLSFDDLALWTIISRVILNLDETITKG